MRIAKLTEHVNFRITPEEKRVWLEYCHLTARSQNDVFRGYLRTLAKKLSHKGAPLHHSVTRIPLTLPLQENVGLLRFELKL